jgi:protein associated with RNAse G/E
VNIPLVGAPIEVRALHSDGTAYRWWPTTVESASANALVTYSAPGKLIHGPAGSSVATFHIRATYWYERPYNLFEVYRADGHLLEVYVNIASPAHLDGHTLTFTDHELDVVLQPGQPPVVVDEDEFAEAAERYGYSAEFQAACHQAVADVLSFIQDWQPAGLPAFPQ